MKNFKILVVIISCLLLVISTNDSCAQEKAKNAEQGWFVSEYWSPIYCDGELVDFLEGGVLRIHYVSRLEPFVSYKEIDQIKGEVTSTLNGEVFKVRETDKHMAIPGSYIITWRYNLKGNMGTQYHGEVTFNVYTGEFTIGKTMCN